MKLAILGLDGLYPAFLGTFAEAIPVLAGLRNAAFAPHVLSTVPPYTPQAWTTLTTGVNPGVHGIAGIWGAVAAGLWATAVVPGNTTDGLFYGNFSQVFTQLKAVVYTLVWSGIASYVLLKVIDVTWGLRSSDHEERVGLDLTEHAETAYTLVD